MLLQNPGLFLTCLLLALPVLAVSTLTYLLLSLSILAISTLVYLLLAVSALLSPILHFKERAL